MTEAEVRKTLKETLVARLFLKKKPEEIGDNDLLITTLGIDSVRLFEIVIGLEETFGISFEDNDFNLESFKDVVSISKHVQRKLAEAGR